MIKDFIKIKFEKALRDYVWRKDNKIKERYIAYALNVQWEKIKLDGPDVLLDDKKIAEYKYNNGNLTVTPTKLLEHIHIKFTLEGKHNKGIDI